MILYFVLLLSYLLPNHYLPWPAAWNDFFAFLFLALIWVLAVIDQSIKFQISRIIFLTFGLLFISSLLHRGNAYLGDVVMVLLYAGVWWMAIVLGRSFAVAGGSRRQNLLYGLSWVWLVASVLSMFLALWQWSRLGGAIWVVDLPEGGRPFANLAQPNNLSTLLVFGVVGALGLHEMGKYRTWVLVALLSMLLLGVVITQSRTGWLQVALLVAMGLYFKARFGLKAGKAVFLFIAGWFVALVIFWPLFNEWVGTSAGRTLEDQMRLGTRWPFWLQMVDALTRQPWTGYGWQQVSLAQQTVALDHPSVGALFEHSHNFFLDLLLWNGIPLGLLLVGLIVYWFAYHLLTCRDPRAWILLMGLMGLMVHGMLEFPLEYAYFLVPAGLAMGAVEALNPRPLKTWAIPVLGFRALGVVFTALFVWISVEYIQIEEHYRTVRLEQRFNAQGVVTPQPDIKLLTQLDAFLVFMKTEAKPGMTEAQVDWMKKVSQRFPYPPAMFRYALAAGLNGRSADAEVTLQRLCRIHAGERCDEAIEGWSALRLQYPILKEIDFR